MVRFIITVANGAETSLFGNILFLFHKNPLSKVFTLPWAGNVLFVRMLFIYVFLILKNFIILLNILTFVNDEEKRPIALVA